jgi:predicted transposase YdaD
MGNPLEGIDKIAEIKDPAERAREIGRRLGAIPDYQEQLRKLRQTAVLEMRAAGMTYAQIGTEIHLHRNRVQQIAEGRTAGGQGGGNKARAEAGELT